MGFAIDALDFETQFSLVISFEMQGKAVLFHLGHLAALQTTYLNIQLRFNVLPTANSVIQY